MYVSYHPLFYFSCTELYFFEQSFLFLHNRYDIFLAFCFCRLCILIEQNRIYEGNMVFPNHWSLFSNCIQETFRFNRKIWKTSSASIPVSTDIRLLAQWGYTVSMDINFPDLNFQIKANSILFLYRSGISFLILPIV